MDEGRAHSTYVEVKLSMVAGIADGTQRTQTRGKRMSASSHADLHIRIAMKVVVVVVVVIVIVVVVVSLSLS